MRNEFFQMIEDLHMCPIDKIYCHDSTGGGFLQWSAGGLPHVSFGPNCSTRFLEKSGLQPLLLEHRKAIELVLEVPQLASWYHWGASIDELLLPGISGDILVLPILLQNCTRRHLDFRKRAQPQSMPHALRRDRLHVEAKSRPKSTFSGVSQDGSGRWESYVYSKRRKV